MAINQSMFESLQPGVTALTNQRAEADRANQEAALKKYLQAKEPEIAGQKQTAQNTANLQTLSNPALGQFLQPGGSVGVGDIKVGKENKPTTLPLTPAQTAAEHEAGKKIAEFEGGGKSASESNLAQIQGVQGDLSGGKRDQWDQRVGGLLENHPTLMSMFSPTEKARRDSVQNAMLGMLHEAGIPRPTQWDIQRVFGQVYDPASDDKTNMVRLQNAVSKMKGHQQSMQDEADRYHKTGYATIGGGSPPAPPAASPQTPPSTPPPGMSFEQYKAWKAKQ